MRPTTIEELDWLHDSDLLNILFDMLEDADWSIRLTLRCPTDSGYAPWEGKLLVVVAIEVVRSAHVVCGVAGAESVDYINTGVSSALRESALKGKSADALFNFEFTIHFTSGSVLEVICQELQVEVS